MIIVAIVTLIACLIFSFVYKFCIVPYRKMQHYKAYKGVDSIPFIPFFGSFLLA